MGIIVDMATKKYGRLTGIERVGVAPNRQSLWRFKCDCGVVTILQGSSVRHGNTASCGCLQKELARENIRQRATTHGMTSSPEFVSWTAAKSRCYYRKNKEYARYGGSGITMCDKWRLSFSEFYKDMGQRPSGTSLDRVDPSGNYEPGNCRWATHTEQSRNRRNSIYVDHLGRRIPLTEFAEITGVKYATAFRRYKKNRSLTN